MTEYGFKLVIPNSLELARSGFGKVAHVPAIFDSEPGYARLPSRFLIDRGLGIWDPSFRGTKLNPSLPSRISIKNFGYWLCNALEWAHVRGIDLMQCDYSTVLIGRYQQEMLKGTWSLRGEPLAAGTVNARVGAALEFQMWCSDKGYRELVRAPTVKRSYTTGLYNRIKSNEVITVGARKGKVKANKHNLVFPTDDEISMWRKRVYAQPLVGTTHGLMVDHVMGTGIRREELACWRIDTLPLDPRDWRIVNPQQPKELQQVSLVIEKGAKGRQFYIDELGDKVGPRGNILLPLSLCRRIDDYRNNERLLALKNITRGVRDRAKFRQLVDQSVHLYLHPTTGKRYTGDQIYQLWTTVEHPEHWSPHLARDWWACQYLWGKMREHSVLINRLHDLTKVGADHWLLHALKDTALNVVRMEIQPQLRHARHTTTEIYLTWLFNQLRVPLDLTLQWHEEDGGT